MYRIGEFSTLSKTTVKTLRYYEKEGLLAPAFVDRYTGYRFYKTEQLVELSKIIALRQIGISVKDIRRVLYGGDMTQMLTKRKAELEAETELCRSQLSKVNYLLEGKEMEYEVITKQLPDYVVYYKEGVIAEYKDIANFILTSAEECREANPNVKCLEPDYCYVSYLDGEYKENDVKIKYAQAVEKQGEESKTIKFEKLTPVDAVCIYHKGAYENLSKAYGFIMNYIDNNGFEIVELPRERYIDGMWNKADVGEWLTEIQVPVRKK